MYKVLNKYNWLIFDADNTLFDYDTAEKNALIKTLNDYEIHFDSDSIIETYHNINHKLWMKFETGEIKSQSEIKYSRTQQLFDALKVQRNIKKFADDYLNNLSKNDQLLNNALNIIQALYKTHRMIIMTNGMTKVQKPRFNNSVIRKYFEHIVISEEINHAKPSKEIFEHAFCLMNQPNKKEVLMIGDNLGSDVQGGINYGIDTVWYNPSKIIKDHNASYEISDLLAFIKKARN